MENLIRLKSLKEIYKKSDTINLLSEEERNSLINYSIINNKISMIKYFIIESHGLDVSIFYKLCNNGNKRLIYKLIPFFNMDKISTKIITRAVNCNLFNLVKKIIRRTKLTELKLCFFSLLPKITV